VKAFITGATGFLGGHLVRALHARGDTVVALARRADAAADLERGGATAVRGSLEDEALLAAALAGVNVVYHVAGLTSGTPAELAAVNEAGTARLLRVVRAAAPAARVVYVSSQAALGPSAPGTPLDESAPCRPVTHYGRSKLAGERLVAAHEGPWTIVRPPSVYGPGDREFLQLFRIVRTGLAPVFGTGAQELSLVFVGDLAESLVHAGTAAAAGGQVLHAAHEEIVRARDVARMAARVQGRRALTVPVPGLLARPIVSAMHAMAAAAGRRTVVGPDKMAEFLASGWLLDSARIRSVTGWRATTDLATGFARTAAWYREQGWL